MSHWLLMVQHVAAISGAVRHRIRCERSFTVTYATAGCTTILLLRSVQITSLASP